MNSSNETPQSNGLKQLEECVLETIENIRQLEVMIENFHPETEPHWFKNLFVTFSASENLHVY